MSDGDRAIDDARDRIDQLALGQIAVIKPDREQVVTWAKFRCLVGRFEDGQFFIETRSMDGSEVHQFLLDEDTRQMLVDALGRGSDNPADRLIVP